MKVKLLSCLVTLLALLGAGVSWGDEYYLYRPEPVAGEVPPPGREQGVLVKSVRVREGDTLGKLAKRYAGKWYYYPQILLFNEIRNPNLIYTGDALRIPVEHATSEESVSKTPKDKSSRVKGRTSAKPPGGRQAGRAEPIAKTAKEEQRLFAEAIKAYRNGDYQGAQQLFDRFIETFPNSPLAADAFLYRGDSYLQQSR